MLLKFSTFFWWYLIKAKRKEGNVQKQKKKIKYLNEIVDKRKNMMIRIHEQWFIRTLNTIWLQLKAMKASPYFHVIFHLLVKISIIISFGCAYEFSKCETMGWVIENKQRHKLKNERHAKINMCVDKIALRWIFHSFIADGCMLIMSKSRRLFTHTNAWMAFDETIFRLLFIYLMAVDYVVGGWNMQ